MLNHYGRHGWRMLGFERDVFLNVATVEPAGSLCLFGVGLLTPHFTHHLVQHFSHPAGLVLAINLSNDYLPTVDSSVPPQKRSGVYQQGGVVCITANVLLIDLLQGRLLAGVVSGVMLFVDGREVPWSVDGMHVFCVDLIKQENPQVFIRVFSDRLDGLTGFGMFERCVKALHVQSVHFYPRFNQAVLDDLDGVNVSVVEVKVSLSGEAKCVQVLLMDLLNSCRNEILAKSPQVDPEDLSLNHLLSSNAHWKLGNLKDLDVLQRLLRSNMYCENRLAFKKQLESEFKALSCRTPADIPSWMHHDSAELLLRSVSEGLAENPKLAALRKVLSECVDGDAVVVTHSMPVKEQLEQSFKHKVVLYNPLDDDWLSSSTVIMYELSLALIRKVEVFKSRHSETICTVYYLMYTDSMEEQKYLHSLRRERRSFEQLITAYASMPAFVRESDAEQSVESSADDANSDMVVDVRELRSSLPYHLHKQANLRILPFTLTTADYIPADDVGVERKAWPDLLSSLSSGRLYSQSERLCNDFALPVLLIELPNELDQSPFPPCWNTVSVGEVICKLALLLLHRPALRCIWSGSDVQSVQHFTDLKRNRSLKDRRHMANVNTAAKSVLLSMRGVIDEGSVGLVMSSFPTLRHVFIATGDELRSKLGGELGSRLFEYLNKS